jgi:hypothetical protein
MLQQEPICCDGYSFLRKPIKVHVNLNSFTYFDIQKLLCKIRHIIMRHCVHVQLDNSLYIPGRRCIQRRKFFSYDAWTWTNIPQSSCLLWGPRCLLNAWASYTIISHILIWLRANMSTPDSITCSISEIKFAKWIKFCFIKSIHLPIMVSYVM